MPPQSRAQRKRQNANKHNQRAQVAKQNQGVAEATVSPEASVTPNTSATVPLRQPTTRANRRGPNRAVTFEPIDYSADYDAARQDLRWIALWSVVVFGIMIALKFSGLL